MIQRGDKKITSVPMRRSLSPGEALKSEIVRHLKLLQKTNMNKKATGVYDHMPTVLYVQSDTCTPDSGETKQDVPPVWNRVPCRTAGNNPRSFRRKLVITPHVNKEIFLQNTVNKN